MSALPALLPFQDLAPDLTDQEQLLLYNIEVLGLSILRSADIAGVGAPYYVLKKPHMIAARAQYRDSVRGMVDFSRDDVIFGIKEAVDQAKTMADPMAQIAGWREIGKLKGFDKLPNINITLTGTVEDMRRQLQSMSTDALLRMAGENILDADFYRVNAEQDSGDTESS